MWNKKNKAVLALILIAVLFRVIILLNYYPATHADTISYMKLALQIKHLDFSLYDGWRTPGYPLIILLHGFNLNAIWIVQSIMGVMISLMLFTIALNQTNNIFLSFLIGLTHALSANQIFYEATVLTEIWHTFFLFLSLLVLLKVYSLENINKKSLFYLFAAGIITALAGLTHPLLLILSPVYFTFLFFWACKATVSLSYKSLGLAAFIIPIIVLIGGWSSFNKITLNYFGPNTTAGFNLVRQCINFVEYAPDEYADIRDTFLAVRQDIKHKNNPISAVRPAFNKIRKETKVSVPELSKKLTRMSIALIMNHPILYLKAVYNSLIRFWFPIISLRSEEKPNPKIMICPKSYGENHEVDIPRCIDIKEFGIFFPFFTCAKNSAVGKALKFTALSERIFRSLISLIFLVISSVLVYRFLAKKMIPESIPLLLISAIIILSALLASFMETGKQRYSVPFQPLMAYVVIVSIYNYFIAIRENVSH